MNTVIFNLLDSSTWSFVKGMSRTEVSGFLGEIPENFIKNKEVSEISTDNFVEYGVHAYYDAENKLEGIEIFPSQYLRVEISKQNVLGLSALEVKTLCEGVLELRSSDDSFESVDGHIRFYAPDNLILSVYLVLV